MRALVSNLTAVLLVIHAMIGCCHHHWHCDDECATAVAVSTAPCHCCEHHCGSHDERELPFSPCNGERQCHGICTYLPTQKTVIDASHADTAFDFAAVIPTLLDGRLAAMASILDCARTRDESPPPLRLHLLHQILLI